VSQAAGWPVRRWPPGTALRAALLNPDVRPDPRGLKIRGAYITGITDLADLRLSFGVPFDSCAFEESADWSRLRVARLGLTPYLRSPSGMPTSTEPSSGLSASQVAAVGATIGGQLVLRGATLTNEGGVALNLARAGINGNALLNPVIVTGKLWATSATIGVNLRLDGSTLTNEGGDALVLDGIDIKGAAPLEAEPTFNALQGVAWP
jgi:hypothetical protein